MSFADNPSSLTPRHTRGVANATAGGRHQFPFAPGLPLLGQQRDRAPPSANVLNARGRAAALAQTYMPVSRSELRQIIRMRAPGSTSMHTHGDAMNELRRPVTALGGVTSARAAHARAVARCYEMYLADGTDPQTALHAARAKVVGIARRATDEQQRLETLTPRTETPPSPRVPEAAVLRDSRTDEDARRPTSAMDSARRTNTGDGTSAIGNRTDALLPFGYQTLGPIAAGVFSMVVRAKHVESGREVAVKTFLTRSKGGRRPAIAAMKSELACLELLSSNAHPHLANLVESHDSSHEKHAILHYCGGGSVARYLQTLQTRGHGVGLDEPLAAVVVAQVGSALAFMHGAGVTHRDVKPANVIFDDVTRTSVRLVDLGFAAMHRAPASDGTVQTRKLKSTCGTPAYMAPERLRGGAYLGPPVDVWALGALAFELLHNCPAFRAQTIPDLNVRIMKGSHEKFAPTVTSAFKKLIRKTLTVEVKERIEAAMLADLLHKAFAIPQ